MSPIITSATKILQVFKQRQITSGNKLLLEIIILVSDWLIVVLMTIRLGIYIYKVLTEMSAYNVTA